MEMDTNSSAFPSLPLLLHEFDGALPSSEESTPADSPMFYKYGEPSRLSEMKPMFHLPINDTYKVWWDNSFRGKEIDLSYSPCQALKQATGICEDVEMEIDAMPYVSPCTRSLYNDAVTPWLTSDNTVSSSVPVSRSSLFCSQPSQTAVGDGWCESPFEDDSFGPVSTSLSSSEGYNLREGNSSFVAGSQPHNYHYNATSSASLHRSHASTQAVSVLPPIAISSPSFSPSSLDSTSSYSSSASTSLSSCPPTPPTPILLPELRQPRPARPIPIIPLSKLATACEKAYIPSPKSSSTASKSRRSFGESESSDLLSSVFPKSGTRYPLLPLGQISHDTLRFQYIGEGKPNSTYSYLNSWSGHSR